MSEELKHYGVLRRSGRYPWGSGGDPYQRSSGWRSHVQELKKQGLTEAQIAKGEGLSIGEYRARNSISRGEIRAAEAAQALRLKDKGYSNTAIGKLMKKNESSIRSLLDPAAAERAAITETTAKMLKESVDSKKYIDVGSGVENHIGVSRTKLNTAISELQDQGYKVHYVNVPQLGMPGKFTIVKVLGAPDTKWSEVVKDVSKIKSITANSDDFGRTFSDLGLKPIQNISSNRIHVRYNEDGGNDKDGIIELRRGVKDLDLGGSKYAQVRIGVDGTHFLKGMAIYSDDIPDGADIVFNTKKSKSVSKMDTFKEYKKDKDGAIDKDNPFGSNIKPGGQRGALNVVNEEGDWDKWSRNISSQVLSKQTSSLAKQQLELAYSRKKEEYDEIMKITNPAVKAKLLKAFSDSCDSDAVHLKAAALPRQASKVILPITKIKENEVYAPSFNDGESVVLIRHPHGGRFEIPELIVNNKSKEAEKIMKNAKDAIGIHPKVAQKLSGADFDGDTVIVIPNNKGFIKTSASLKGLKNFDPITAYPPYDGMKTVDGGIFNGKTGKVDYGGKKPRKQSKQTKMGEVSNLITDMTIKGANLDEIARAVRHSMVVIDSEKHHLNYKQSYIDNGIASLSKIYQNGKRGGASTLISKASSEVRVPLRTNRIDIDKRTGEKIYTNNTKDSFINKQGKTLRLTTKTTRMAEAKDAFSLSSGTQMEGVYAKYANSLKALGNRSRLDMINITPIPYNPSARKVYEKEVGTLVAKLNTALRNSPIERQAQILANATVKRKMDAFPDMDEDELKKIRNQALATERVRTGAKKNEIKITDREWEAIQAGAITQSRLKQILDNTDLDRIKELATPRKVNALPRSKLDKAMAMLKIGYTQSEIAESLGVSVNTLSNSLNKEGN